MFNVEVKSANRSRLHRKTGTVVTLFVKALLLISCGVDMKTESLVENRLLVADAAVDSYAAADSLLKYRQAAAAKNLPTPFFDQLISAKSWISLKKTSGGPSYRPGILTGGTIYHPSIGISPYQWFSNDWSNFYNELFHAWWGNVFMKEARYASLRNRFPSNPALLRKYRAAHPRNPVLAMEEAWSETVASMLTIWYPRPYFDQDGKLLGYRNPDFSKMAYKLHHTVAPVSHSDRPGYTPAAESTYPDESEYSALLEIMFGKTP